jgi:ABC-type nitrate/sulfonate/bicarbonate transport system permease component
MKLRDHPNSSSIALLLGMAFGSAMGIPRGFRVKHNTPSQATADRLAQIDAANRKRARKMERNRKLAAKA